MMRLGDTRTISRPRQTTPVADRDLDDILRIPHTAMVLSKLAELDPSIDSEQLRIETMRTMLDEAMQRDLLLLDRPAGCWCFGRGGMHERAVMVPGSEVPMVLSVYCSCPDGELRKESDDQVRHDGRAYAQQARVSALWESARVPGRFNGCTLDTFPITTRQQATLVARLRNWLIEPSWAIVLHGPFGVGKTGLGIGLLKAAAEHRTVGLFVKAPDLLSRVRATYGKNSDATELDVLDSLRSVQLLMLDDIGADRQTDWATDMLFQVLDARHDANLKTIITTNLDIAGLSVHLGERTAHRFEEGAVLIHVDGPNLRKDQKGA